MDPSVTRISFHFWCPVPKKPVHASISVPKSEKECMFTQNEETPLHRNENFNVIRKKLDRNQFHNDIMASNKFHRGNEPLQSQDFDFIRGSTTYSSSTAPQASHRSTAPNHYDHGQRLDQYIVPTNAVPGSVRTDVPSTLGRNEECNGYNSDDVKSKGRLPARIPTAMTTMTTESHTATSLAKSTQKKKTKSKSGEISKKGRRISSNSTLPCPVCSQTYSRKDNLRAHMRIHSGERPYKCKQCTSKFRWLGALRKHLANDHSKNGLEKSYDNNSNFHDSSNVKSEKSTTSHMLNTSEPLAPQMPPSMLITEHRQTEELERCLHTDVCILPGSSPTTSQDMCSTDLNTQNMQSINNGNSSDVTCNPNININSNLDNNSSDQTTNNLKETAPGRNEEDILLDVLWTLPEPWTMPEPMVNTVPELTPHFLSIVPKI